MTMTIDEKACRGCELCVDVCPTDVITFDKEALKARVERVDDCIACLSCAYICPSAAIEHKDFHKVQNYYRDMDFVEKAARFI